MDFEREKRAKRATTGFVLGIIGLVAWLLPIACYAVCIVGLIFSIIGVRSDKKVFAILGIIFNAVALEAAAVNSLLGMIQQLQALQ